MPQEFTNEDAKIFLERITPNNDYLYIFQPQGPANILCAGGFSYAAQTKKNKIATVLIVQEGLENFGIKYENVIKISYISPQILNAVQKYLDDSQIHETDNFIYGYLDTGNAKNFTVAEGLSLIDYYREKVFNLPPNTPCHSPIITPPSEDDIAYWNQQYILDKERTIILSAYVNPENKPEIKFWINLAQKLVEKKYIVYSYVKNFSDRTIPNIKAIYANLSELSYIADNVKCFVSSHPGISNFLAMNTNAKIFSINEFPVWFWDTKINFPKSNSHTFYIVNKFLEPIFKSVDKDGVIIQLEFFHPNISSQKIFYSYEDMLKNISEAVYNEL